MLDLLANQIAMAKDQRIAMPFAQSRLEVGAYDHGFLVWVAQNAQWFDGIWVIVDKFTETTHFIPIKETFPLDKLAKLYVDKIVSLCETLVSIVSNKIHVLLTSFG